MTALIIVLLSIYLISILPLVIDFVVCTRYTRNLSVKNILVVTLVSLFPVINTIFSSVVICDWMKDIDKEIKNPWFKDPNTND